MTCYLKSAPSILVEISGSPLFNGNLADSIVPAVGVPTIQVAPKINLQVLKKVGTTSDSSNIFKRYSPSEAMSIFKENSGKEIQLKNERISKWKELELAKQHIADSIAFIPFQPQNIPYASNSLKPDENFLYSSPFSNKSWNSGKNNVIYTEKLAPVNKINAEKVQLLSSDWFLIVLLLSLLLLAWVKNFFGKSLLQVVQSGINIQISQRLFNDRNLLLQRVTFFLIIIFILIISLFIYLMMAILGNSSLFTYGFKNYISIIGLVSAFLAFKVSTASIVGHVFKKQKLFSEYLHNVFLSYENTGLFLLPIVILIGYVTPSWHLPLVYIGILIIGLIFILRYVRLYILVKQRNVYFLYLILYFCTFELLPIILVGKLLKMFVV